MALGLSVPVPDGSCDGDPEVLGVVDTLGVAVPLRVIVSLGLCVIVWLGDGLQMACKHTENQRDGHE